MNAGMEFAHKFARAYAAACIKLKMMLMPLVLWYLSS